MLNVFLTVDTELWPLQRGWPRSPLPAGYDKSLARELEIYIYGATPQGEYGLRWQLDTLRQHGLKASFFIESLFASITGLAPLQAMVRTVQDAQQEIALHVHSEWLAEIHASGLPELRQHLHQFNVDGQTAIIHHAFNTLVDAGAPPPVAFRAGSYGMNRATLTAVARNGMRYDTSYNHCHRNSQERYSLAQSTQPQQIDGVYELPVAIYAERPRRYRHAQIGANSFAELKSALNQAERAGWKAFVIVLHSSEFIAKHRLDYAHPIAQPDRIAIRRFEQLCAFLAAHPERFRTTTFAALDPAELQATNTYPEIATGIWLMWGRQFEQLRRRYG